MNITRIFQAVGTLAVALAATPTMAAEPQQVVPSFEASKYAGTWYEIARFREIVELSCENVTATYTPDSTGKIQVLNQCERPGGIHSNFQAVAYAPNPDEPARLVLQSSVAGIESTAPYNVLALDSEYQWAMVGEPELKHLWILSRTPYIDTNVLKQLVDVAQSQFGYTDVDTRLHCTTQPEGANVHCQEVLTKH